MKTKRRWEKSRIKRRYSERVRIKWRGTRNKRNRRRKGERDHRKEEED